MASLPATAFHLPFANRSAPLYHSVFLEPLHALDDRGRPHAARNCTAQEAAHNAADNDHCRPLTQTLSLGDSKEYPCDALAVNSLDPYPLANAKSNSAPSLRLHRGWGDFSGFSVPTSRPISHHSCIPQSYLVAVAVQKGESYLYQNTYTCPTLSVITRYYARSYMWTTKA